MGHIAVIKNKPVRSGKKSAPDGAINGNGDLGIILGNCINGLRIYISKCDVWQFVENCYQGGLKPVGYIDIPVDESLYENYYVEQDMDKGEIRCVFRNESRICEIHTRVCKIENSIMLETKGNVEVSPVLQYYDGDSAASQGKFVKNGIESVYRSFYGEDHLRRTDVFVSSKKVSNNKFYYYVCTNFDNENPSEYSANKAEEITEEEYSRLLYEHYSSWKNFYSESSFILSDKQLENEWYASQYFLACTSGNKKFPPGLFANFITVENPDWHSDYHLNYNYQAPFYAACSSNHIECTDCYHAPLEDFFEKGKEFAKKFGCGGILYPVGLAPMGMLTEYNPELKHWFLRLFLGQKSNAVHPADIMIFRWKATRDKDYAKNHAYPYVKACIEFFEDYCTVEKGKLCVTRDAVHEVPYYKTDFSEKKYRKVINDKNNVLTLGVLRLCIEAGIDMAEALQVDEHKRNKWTMMLQNLSDFPTYYRLGKEVYRYTEKGQSWNESGDVGLQHIYPAGCVGYLSDKKTLKIARNTFRQKEGYCYEDDNAVSSFFPMAARLNMNPSKIIAKLKNLRKKRGMENMLYDFAGGCLENCPIFANTLNEMALQVYRGIIIIFPCWDKSIDAKFKKLRADGAFLVSSEIKNGFICQTEIMSEKGEVLKIKNPFSKCEVICSDGCFETSNDIIVLKTVKNEIIKIKGI